MDISTHYRRRVVAIEYSLDTDVGWGVGISNKRGLGGFGISNQRGLGGLRSYII